jgi:AcrR family transcriptional regulator
VTPAGAASVKLVDAFTTGFATMPTDNDDDTAGQKRRSPGKARDQLIVSARELFAANGYAGTSTRQIAQHAGVHESLFYRHFRTKANLFDAAVVEPIREFVAGFLREWADRKELMAPAEVPSWEFIGGLYDLARKHRTLIMALASAHAFHADAFTNGDRAASAPLTDVLVGLREFVENAAEQNQFTWLDASLAIRYTIDFVIGVAVLDELLFPTDTKRLGRDETVRELVGFVIHGIGHPRPPIDVPSPSRRTAKAAAPTKRQGGGKSTNRR